MTFTEEPGAAAKADVRLVRGSDGGAYTLTSVANGSGSTPGIPDGQSTISIDTSVFGFSPKGWFDPSQRYGLGAVVHEVGHLLGLGHAGNYNGNVDPATQQHSAYDDRMYSIMSYITWLDDNARYADQNPNKGTDWGNRDNPHTLMPLDILAVQQLYGVSLTSPFEGGQTFGFHSNVQGSLHDFYDFTVNTDPC